MTRHLDRILQPLADALVALVDIVGSRTERFRAWCDVDRKVCEFSRLTGDDDE